MRYSNSNLFLLLWTVLNGTPSCWDNSCVGISPSESRNEFHHPSEQTGISYRLLLWWIAHQFSKRFRLEAGFYLHIFASEKRTKGQNNENCRESHRENTIRRTLSVFSKSPRDDRNPSMATPILEGVGLSSTEQLRRKACVGSQTFSKCLELKEENSKVLHLA